MAGQLVEGGRNTKNEEYEIKEEATKEREKKQQGGSEGRNGGGTELFCCLAVRWSLQAPDLLLL